MIMEYDIISNNRKSNGFNHFILIIPLEEEIEISQNKKKSRPKDT